MTPAAVKTATCQKRQLALSEAALSTIEIRCPLTRIILESRPSIYSLVVADTKHVHQRKASKRRGFRSQRNKKASHSVKRRR